MNGHEVRRRFLEYFERNAHRIVPSSPVLPANDPTLLFTNAGMNQFKDTFLGNEKRDYARAASSQKCIRAGGKHNDLDEVGKTARHHTFFEMLGNFSFGDYFKADAIRFAWDFLVNELKLEPNRLWFSYFGGDEEVTADTEARDLWIKAGAAPERVLPFGRKDNFWQMGDEGPCGPCSEIHYFMGENPNDPAQNHPKYVNGEGDTTMEIWNLVFMQFNRTGIGEKGADGKYSKFDLTPLPAPSVDTGAGLERLAAVLQGVKTNYDTDLLLPIINFTAKLAGKTYEYETPEGFAMRVVADHARTTAFSIADGILPGNKERDSVLRKIMRRAIYQGRKNLGFNSLFFYQVCDFVIDQMKEAYPELEKQRKFISERVRDEEKKFERTLTAGLKKFEENLPEILGIGKFEEDLSELISIEKRISNVIWNVESIANTQNNDDEIAKIKFQHEQKFGFGEIHQKLARLTNKHKIPPYQVPHSIKRILSAGKFNFPEGGFGLGQFAVEVYLLLRDEGNDDEKSLTKSFTQEDFLNFLDITFDGTPAKYYPNFKLFAKYYDTYGTPRDLIRVLLEDAGIAIEEDYFNKSFDLALAEIQQQSGIGKTQQKEKINPLYTGLTETIQLSDFRGYEVTTVENAKVVALIKNDERTEVLNEGDEGLIILNETPFYAESGGQVGDTGLLVRTAYGSRRLNVETSPANFEVQPSATADGSDFRVKVFDTFAPLGGIVLHKSKIEKGSINVGDAVTAIVDAEKRDATRRNHTATHLLHAALREVLGTHVKQAGSVVAPNFLRFDFSHYQALTEAETTEIETLVNREILKNDDVNTNLMSIEDAMRTGAMALFGEKYGSEVRVLSVGAGTFSRELCGGTHVSATGDIGSFKIVSEENIASGTRRIRAITGLDAFERFSEDERLIEKSLGALRTQRDQLPHAIEKLQEELKKTRREVEDLKMKIATGTINSGSANGGGDEAREIAGVKVLTKIVEGLDQGAMRNLSDTLLGKMKSGVVVLGRRDEDKVSLIVRSSDDVKARVSAGQVIKEIAPIVGGRGGGKPDMAEGGGNTPEKLDEALAASYGVIEKMLT